MTLPAECPARTGGRDPWEWQTPGMRIGGFPEARRPRVRDPGARHPLEAPTAPPQLAKTWKSLHASSAAMCLDAIALVE